MSWLSVHVVSSDKEVLLQNPCIVLRWKHDECLMALTDFLLRQQHSMMILFLQLQDTGSLVLVQTCFAQYISINQYFISNISLPKVRYASEYPVEAHFAVFIANLIEGKFRFQFVWSFSNKIESWHFKSRFFRSTGFVSGKNVVSLA